MLQRGNRFTFSFLIAASVVVIFFQNCGGLTNSLQSSSSTSGDKKEAGKENGEGYGGKLSYTNRGDGTPCGDGSSIRSRISVDPATSTATVERENCRDVNGPTYKSSDLSLLSHNSNHLIYQSRVFDRVESSDVPTSLFCRGESFDPVARKQLVVDAVVRERSQGGTKSYSGQVILGVYEQSGAFKERRDLGEVAIGVMMPDADHRHYNSLTLQSREVFTLNLQLSTMTARLTYATNMPIPPSTTLGELYTADQLRCYRQ